MTPVITIPPEPLLNLLGENGEHWIKNSWGDDNAMCLHGAIRRCEPHPGDCYLILQVAEKFGWAPTWNDKDTTKWADVRARINGGIDITDSDLEVTFGPQWADIVTIVRQAASLTPDQATRWAAARDAAGDAARDAAWDAAWNAARDAAWAAARDAAGDAAWNAARDAAGDAAGDAARDAAWAAARDAAWATVTRDLIGTAGYTQAHHDLLMAPWVEVFGPI
jgi:hypothetical protein